MEDFAAIVAPLSRAELPGACTECPPHTRPSDSERDGRERKVTVENGNQLVCHPVNLSVDGESHPLRVPGSLGVVQRGNDVLVHPLERVKNVDHVMPIDVDRTVHAAGIRRVLDTKLAEFVNRRLRVVDGVGRQGKLGHPDSFHAHLGEEIRDDRRNAPVDQFLLCRHFCFLPLRLERAYSTDPSLCPGLISHQTGHVIGHNQVTINLAAVQIDDLERLAVLPDCPHSTV